MNSAAQSYIAALQARNMKIKETKEFPNGETGVLCGWRVENTAIDIMAVFPDDGNYVWIRCFNFAKCPRERLGRAIIACNTLNAQYKWVKFYVDESGDVRADEDAIIHGEAGGMQTLEMVLRMAQIVNAAGPAVMKAISG